MRVSPQTIPEVLLLQPNVYKDNRGFFVETMRDSLRRDFSIPPLIQHNQSRSGYGVLRGMHYQMDNPQGKLVRVGNGKIFDVAVDIRKGSPSFGKWVGAFLDDISHYQLWIPKNFAHGFLVLSESADVCYSCTNYYDPVSERGIIWNDKDINIKWPLLKNNKLPIVSEKDKQLKKLSFIDHEALPIFK